MLRRNFYDLQKGIKSDMNKIHNKSCVGGNDFHIHAILGAI